MIANLEARFLPILEKEYHSASSKQNMHVKHKHFYYCRIKRYALCDVP